MQYLRIAIGLMAVLVISEILVVLLKPGSEYLTTILGNTLYALSALFATSAGVYAYRLFTWRTPQGRILGFLTLGMLLNAVAGIILLFYEAALQTYPYPSLADFFWIFAYVPQLIALAYGCYRIRRFGHGARVLGFFFSWIVLAAAVSVSLIVPVFNDPTTDTFPKIFNILYPSLNLVIMLLTGFLAMVLWGGAFTISWGSVFLGMFLLTFGDLSFTYLIWKGWYATGSPSDLFWIVGFMFIAIGFVQQRGAIETPKGWR